MLDPSLSLGIVEFVGVPNGPGGSDTQVNRLQDADLTFADSTPGEDTIDIEIVQLSLKSIDTFTIGGNTGNILIELNTSDISKNKGTMTITGNSTSGTYDSIFNVFVDIIIGDSIANGAVLASRVDLGNYESNGTQWISLGRLLLATGEIVHIAPTGGIHTVNQVPEPSSLLLLSLGLLPLAYRRKKNPDITTN